MELETTVVAVRELPAGRRREMYALMVRYFQRVRAEQFAADLSEKSWVAVSTFPAGGRLAAFSTLRLLEETVGGRTVRAFYSGDTIVDRDCWGSIAPVGCWLRFIFSRAEAEPGPWYWFLVCKGYRTYRYLPLFFREYLPSPRPAPAGEQAVLDALASARFGAAYDPASGLVRFPGDYALRPGVSDVTPGLLRNPAIAFFQERNPGWTAGAELACLARLERENLRPTALRALREEVPA